MLDDDGLSVFFFKQKTAYEMRISDWSSDVCSSDLRCPGAVVAAAGGLPDRRAVDAGLTADAGMHAIVGAAQAEPEHVVAVAEPPAVGRAAEIGRASCRERVCQYV